jgi:hypothetical protein
MTLKHLAHSLRQNQTDAESPLPMGEGKNRPTIHYFALRQMDTENDLLLRAIDLRRAMLQIVQDRAEAGVVSQLDVARAQTELATAETERLEIQRRRAEMENLLALLCGQNASDFALVATSLSATFSPPAVPLGVPRSRASSSPFRLKLTHHLPPPSWGLSHHRLGT